MNSSGIKRGLAVSAVAAMAFTGVGLTTSGANADSIPAQVGAGTVDLYTGTSGQASFKNDGVDTTVHLVATGGPDVKTVQFSYSTDGGATYTNIGSPVSSSNGFFQAAWAPPTAVYNLPVKIKAQGIASTNTAITGAVATNDATVSSGKEAVNLSSTPASVGVYQQPAALGGSLFGIASGTTSDVSAHATVNLSAPYGAGSNVADTLGAPANGSRTFSGLVDFTGYHWDSAAGGTNDGVIQATDGSDDATAVSLYKQEISAVSAAVVPTLQQNGKTSTATVTVVDQKGAPIAGASVFLDNGTGGIDTTSHSPNGTTGAQLTNSQGQASFDGLAGTSGGTQYKFDVDVNGNGTYDPAGDYQRTVTVKTYSPTLTTLTATAANKAFDRDEVDPANAITVTAKDQNGNGMAPLANLQGKWVTTPFNGGASVTSPAVFTNNGDGTYTVAPPATDGTSVLSSWVETDGTPGESAGDTQAADLTVKIGQAAIKWTTGTGTKAQAAAGSTETVNGVLALPDGTPLPGRDLTISWNDGNASPAVVANNAAQPGRTTRTGDNSADTTTGSDGSFGVALIDPTQDPSAYIDADNGTLTASSANTPGLGDAAAGPASTEVDFLKDSAPAAISAGTDTPTIQNELTPGRPAALSGIRVTNAAGKALAGEDVKVSVDHGFIAGYSASSTNPGNLVADPAAATGGEYGDWKSLGTSETVKTDDNGNVNNLRIAIGRDAGFDDNGAVTTTVTFTAGGVSQTHAVKFDSVDPLNLKDLSATLAPAGQQSANLTKLPKAAQNNVVNVQARAHDQFGNLTDVKVDLTSAGAGEFRWTAGDTGFGTSSQAAVHDNGTTGDQNIAIKTVGNQPETVWKDSTPAPAPARTWVSDNPSTAPLVGTPTTVTWYAVDFSASKFALTHNTADTVAPGTTVTETYTALDQYGAPINGANVGFLRSGPDALQNGNASGYGTTDDNGQVAYIFQGTRAGTAKITAVIGDPNPPLLPTGIADPIPASQASDTVVFKAPTAVVVQHAIKARLSGKDTRKGDKLTVKAGSYAKGATVTIYKVVKGKLVKVGTMKLGASGRATKTVRDTNKKAKTTYVVKVAATKASKAATSNEVTVR